MPVVRKTRTGEVIELPSERVTKACAYMIGAAQVPEWHNDPSYFWNRKVK